ncbi:MAG: TIR domain-containing protein [Fastidiosipila sp.]|nr:TIR domain-containing protein [Fastidiosipila sp.]
MLIFKCKMCGGSLNIEEDKSVATCDYCGTKQTLPKLNDDRRANLYDRANHFRRNNEFDKAMGIYEQILAEDNTDSEAYWSRVLCRYGIEYVEDPATRRRVPTVNRTQYTSIFDDANYKAAIEYGDLHQRKIYEEEAKAINEIQKAILAISQEEDPFDVFICYKDTDNQGRRTQDSVLANDLYHQLTHEGLKVFFSRITLEDKLGSAYEPYIFAALNSAKVMVVIGTRPEYFNAVWVRNEWSRYLALIKDGLEKVLIPAYRDMDPYDLPEEFSHLQAQDMSKLGFMQDLIRGIKKITATESAKTQITEAVVAGAGSANIKSLLDRTSLFLEDGDWSSADQYCERVLDQDPRNALAYLGKLMAESRVKHKEELADCAEPFEDNSNYQKAVRFADDSLKAMLTGYNESIKERIEHNRLDAIYNDAKIRMDSASKEKQYKSIAEIFISISDWRDSRILANICFEKAEADRIAAQKEKKRKKRIASFVLPIAIVIIAFSVVLTTIIIPNRKYKKANSLLETGQIREAYTLYIKLSDYRDSAEKAQTLIGKIRVIFLQRNSLGAGYENTVGLKSDGTVVAAGSNLDEQFDVHKWSGIVAISAGRDHIAGLESNGSVEAVGYNYYGQCDVGEWRDIVAIAVGVYHTVGLKSDGTVVAVGYNGDGQCDVDDWSDVVALSAGYHHTVGLKPDGKVVAVGHNRDEQCDVDDWSDVVAISAGYHHTVGLKSNGTVVAVGHNRDEQCDVDDWSDVVAISAGHLHTVGLKSDGTVVAVGYNYYGQCDVGEWRDIVAISAGYHHTVGLKSDGTVVAIGDNEEGQCDVDGWTDIMVP